MTNEAVSIYLTCMEGNVPKCKKHKIELICPACMGERSSHRGFSRAKKTSAMKNLKLAQRARRKYTRCPRYGSHHFSELTGICPCGYKRPGKGAA